MFRVLIPAIVGALIILLLRTHKENKSIKIIERNESLYRDSTGIEKEYINSNQIKNNRYEY
jgi:hypothetical protein